MIDRGFIKWQPFNSLTPLKDNISFIEDKQKITRPTLFPEEVNIIRETLIDAFYSKEVISLTYYEEGKIKEVTTTIKKINPNSKTIELGSNKILFFHQIVHISS